jgi:hypothetical protein
MKISRAAPKSGRARCQLTLTLDSPLLLNSMSRVGSGSSELDGEMSVSRLRMTSRQRGVSRFWHAAGLRLPPSVARDRMTPVEPSASPRPDRCSTALPCRIPSGQRKAAAVACQRRLGATWGPHRNRYRPSPATTTTRRSQKPTYSTPAEAIQQDLESIHTVGVGGRVGRCIALSRPRGSRLHPVATHSSEGTPAECEPVDSGSHNGRQQSIDRRPGCRQRVAGLRCDNAR